MKRIFFLSKNLLMLKMLSYSAKERGIPFYDLSNESEASFRIEEFNPDIILIEWSYLKDKNGGFLEANRERIVALISEGEETPFKALKKPLASMNWYERLLEI